MTFPVPLTREALGDDWRREVLLARLRALGDDGRRLLLAYMAGSFPATLEVALTRFEGEAALAARKNPGHAKEPLPPAGASGSGS